jgi:proteasome lid subunit RPN8/RPN11
MMYRDWLQRRAVQAAPHEACGFILKDGTIIEIPNAALDSTRNFEMSRKHLCERVPNPQLIAAIWHTHPTGENYPSNADMQSMWWGQWDWAYIIVTADEVTEWPPNFFAQQPVSFWEEFTK